MYGFQTAQSGSIERLTRAALGKNIEVGGRLMMKPLTRFTGVQHQIRYSDKQSTFLFASDVLSFHQIWHCLLISVWVPVITMLVPLATYAVVRLSNREAAMSVLGLPWAYQQTISFSVHGLLFSVLFSRVPVAVQSLASNSNDFLSAPINCPKRWSGWPLIAWCCSQVLQHALISLADISVHAMFRPNQAWWRIPAVILCEGVRGVLKRKSTYPPHSLIHQLFQYRSLFLSPKPNHKLLDVTFLQCRMQTEKVVHEINQAWTQQVDYLRSSTWLALSFREISGWLWSSLIGQIGHHNVVFP